MNDILKIGLGGGVIAGAIAGSVLAIYHVKDIRRYLTGEDRIQIQSGYVQPSKLEISLEDTDSNGEN